MVTRRNVIAAAAALLLAAACILAFFLHIPVRTSADRRIRCLWESGAREEAYAEVLGAIAGVREGEIVLRRGSEEGVIEAGECFETVRTALSEGNLFDLITLDTQGLAPIERAALFMTFGRTLYYSGEAFVFDGTKVSRSDMVCADRVVLLEGSLPAHYLGDVGATALSVRADAEISAADLVRSNVCKLDAEAPYRAEGDSLFLTSAGRTRLVASLPSAVQLTVADCDYADMGALSACRALTALSLPFLGNSKTRVTAFDGTLAWLFWTDEGNTMPATLASLTVRGGFVDAYALTGTPIEEVTLCGVPPENISRSAFLGMPALRRLHTPRTDVLLDGWAQYSSVQAPCGCTVYEKI